MTYAAHNYGQTPRLYPSNPHPSMVPSFTTMDRMSNPQSSYTHHQQQSAYQQQPPQLQHQQHYGMSAYQPQPPMQQQPPQQQLNPPGQQGAPHAQQPSSGRKTPVPKIGEDDNYSYQLVVVQSPVRARMCGFGDKDRRPITPPPCIRLVIRDRATGQEIPKYEDIDQTWFVVTVDLWSQDAQSEINLVRHSATSPSISATSAASYPPNNNQQITFPGGAPMTQVHLNMTSTSQPPQSYYVPEPYGSHHPQYADHSRPYYASNQGNQISYGYGGALGQPGSLMTPNPPVMVTQDPRSAPSGMFTRNLIGSLCVSAFSLEDPDKKRGIWFILQDLSVRTEGSFRLKFSFVNIGSKQHPGQLNTNSAPVLATVYSDSFQVFSAKKFPGVIESTRLSKCFAQQGELWAEADVVVYLRV